MESVYRLNVAGLERELKLCPVGEDLSIAAFIMFGDVEMTIRCAEELLRRVPAFDLILTAEAKSIPLAYEMARQSGKPYLPARKGRKTYMTDPVRVEVKSITTEALQQLYLDRADLDAMRGRRVLIVDDVISTGQSLRAMEELVSRGGGTVAARAAVLAEGDAARREDLIFLAELPLFPH